MTAKEYIQEKGYYPDEFVVSRLDADIAIEMVRKEEREKALHAFKENCQNPRGVEGCRCELCVWWVGAQCDLYNGFKDLLIKLEER